MHRPVPVKTPGQRGAEFGGERAIRAGFGSSGSSRTGITIRGLEGEDDTSRDERQQQFATHREEARARTYET
eukprot:2662183-Pyramimonas_sp.AAC.1